MLLPRSRSQSDTLRFGAVAMRDAEIAIGRIAD
jgi:hypothetical protein